MNTFIKAPLAIARLRDAPLRINAVNLFVRLCPKTVHKNAI